MKPIADSALARACDDVREAARSLRRSRGFTAAALITIALGVGVNSGLFTLLNGVLFRDLPAPAAHELVSIYQRVEGGPQRRGYDRIFSTAEYRAYRERMRTLGVLGHSEPVPATLGGESPRQTNGLLVTCDYFDVLRQAPVVGRALTEDDCAAGAGAVVVLGHELWSSAFGADPAIVGSTVELNRQLLTVVGVAAERTYGGFVYAAGFFAPISAEPLLAPSERQLADDQAGWLFLVGRRQDHTDLDRVRAELAVVAAQIDSEQPGRSTVLDVERATPLSIPGLRGIALGAGAVVMVAFALVLLITCANVANLVLARGVARGREIAVRVALGATRARIVRRLLTESVLLSLAGGILGSALAIVSFRALLAFVLPSLVPAGLPAVAIDTSPDVRVLALAAALALGTGVVFGLVPALRASRPDLHAAMKQDSPGAGPPRRSRLQSTLVGAQAALAVLLVTGAALLLLGLRAAHTVDPGFAYENVIVAQLDLEAAGYDRARGTALRRRLLETAAALPSVDAVAYAAREPLGDDLLFAPMRLPSEADDSRRIAERNDVTPGYFTVLDLPIVRGRDFGDADLDGEPRVAIVTQATARNLWPRADPIGQTIVLRTQPDRDVALEVVGVVGDAQVSALGRVDPYYVYLPVPAQEVLLVRARSGVATLAPALRAALRALDPTVAVRVEALETNLDWWRNVSGTVTTLAAALGALALALAAVGIHGTVAYFVTRRFKEIGVRVALGARARDVLVWILRSTLRPVLVGAALGVAAATAATRILSSVLFGVSPLDPLGFGAAAVFVLGIALAAGVLAVRPALRADPSATLRSE